MALIWNGLLVVVFVVIDFLPCLPVIAAARSHDLRLTGGQSEVEGRLEIEYSLNQWGSICNDKWDWPATFVACNQLGLGPPLDHQFKVPTDFGIPIVFDDVVCQGNESRLIDCSHNGLMNHDCTHSEDVTIRCAPNTGVSDYTVETVSDLQTVDMFTFIYINASWQTFCQLSLNKTEAYVLCHQLGFNQPNVEISVAMSVPAVFHSYECLASHPVCEGTENHLRDCRWVDAGFRLPLPYLNLQCDAMIVNTEYNNVTQGVDDSRGISAPLARFIIFLVLFAVVVCLVLICKLYQKGCEPGFCESVSFCANETAQEQERPPQIQVISVRNLDEDEDLSLYSQYATEVQELPGDVPPTYDQYVNNPTLFRTFSEVRGSENVEFNSQVEDAVESPPPDYESATFGFSVGENESESSFDTRL